MKLLDAVWEKNELYLYNYMELMQEGLSILLQAALRKGETIEAHSLLDRGARLNSDLIKFANLTNKRYLNKYPLF